MGMPTNEKVIFVGYGDVYLIEGLEMDVEKDYANEDDLEKAINDLCVYIEEKGLEPVRSKSGYIPLPMNEDTLVYQVNENAFDYVAAFDVHDALEQSAKKEKKKSKDLER